MPTCTTCGYATSHTANFKRHEASHAKLRPFSCISCPYSCASGADLARHVLRHQEASTYACKEPSCSYTCKLPTTLFSHVKSVHGGAGARRPPRLSAHLPVHPCGLSTCDYRTPHLPLMRAHRAKMHDPLRDNALACMQLGCGFTTADYGELLQHARRHAGQKRAAQAAAQRPPVDQAELGRGEQVAQPGLLDWGNAVGEAAIY